jgi:2-hydroxymuconate-semialdehyde hydrolase
MLAAGFRVLVPDLAGYGVSEAVDTESVGMARQARWVFELLDALGIGRAAVAAHDVGSAAAQLMVFCVSLCFGKYRSRGR